MANNKRNDILKEKDISHYKYLKRYRNELVAFYDNLTDNEKLVDKNFALFSMPINELETKINVSEQLIKLEEKDAQKLYTIMRFRLVGLIWYLIIQLILLLVITIVTTRNTSDSTIAIIITNWSQAIFTFTIPYYLYVSASAQLVPIVSRFVSEYTKLQLYRTIYTKKMYLIKNNKIKDDWFPNLSKEELIDYLAYTPTHINKNEHEYKNFTKEAVEQKIRGK